MFPFVIPWDDATPGTATDMSFLNTCPAGRDGPIVVKDGHFVEERTGRRLRFLAVDLTARAAFPSHSEADRVAAHLAKMGVNLVRFHHLQNPWDPKGMIWKTDRIYLELDPNSLDRLDYLISALKRHGIYSNLNLQTTRSYLPEMGFPASVTQLPDYAKRVDKFDRHMIALQKQYARDLLDRKNPYTGNRYADEPALMVVEINNENSLVGAPWESNQGLLALPEPFRGELVALWNAWLTKKYGSDQLLRAAWSGNAVSGTSLLGPSSTWSFDTNGTAQLDLHPSPSSGTGSAPDLEVRVSQADGTGWHAQCYVPGLSLSDGQDYTLTFEARSDAPRQAELAAVLDRSDWHSLGLSRTVRFGPDWKRFAVSFTATATEPSHARVGFELGQVSGTSWIRNIQLVPGIVGGGLKPTESLSKLNVDLPDGGTRQMESDFRDFLTAQEKAYDTEMRTFLKRGLGIKCNIIDTQVAWGGLTSLVRESDSEFADNHAYFNHPEFPGKPWDESNWLVRDTAMTDEMDKDSYGVLGDLALTRFAGRPYSISEYNEPAPNDHQVETMPLLSSFAAVQDWDCLYLFDYGTYGDDEKTDQIQGFFGVGTNPAKIAFFPAAALMFRQQDVPSALDQEVLRVSDGAWNRFPNAREFWLRGDLTNAARRNIPNLYSTRVGLSRDSWVIPSVGASRAKPIVSVHRNPAGAVYQVDGLLCKVAVGSIGGQTIALGGLTLAVEEFGGNFGALCLTARDAKPLDASGDILITAMGRAENQDMGWNKDRTSVGNRWGHGPVLCEGVPCRASLKTSPGLHVFALGPDGKRKHEVETQFANGELTFRISPSQGTVWYEMAR